MKLADKPTVHIVAIIDRSGSMHNIHDDSIGGFNSFIAEQKKIDGPAKLSLVLFDDNYQVVYDDLDLKDVPELTKDVYTLGGMTAMNDAICRTLTKAFEQNPEKAIICILTDGQENASKNYNVSQAKEMIQKARNKGWEVAFLAANQDAFAVANAYGMNTKLAANFTQDAAGTQAAYRSLAASTTSYRAGTPTK